MWALYAFGAAFLHATLFALTKYWLKTVPRTLFLGLSWASSALILLLLNLGVGLPPLRHGFLFAITATTLLNIAGTYLVARSLEESDLSLAFPMLAFTPVFLLVTSPLLRGEWPSPLGVLGILLVTLGAYLLNFTSPRELLAPFRALARDTGVRFMLLAAFLFSLSANYDKTSVETSNLFLPPLIVFAAMGIFYLTGYWRAPATASAKGIIGSCLTGFVPATGVILQNLAYLSAIVPYVITIKRTSLLFSLLYAQLLFKEQQLAQRGLATLIMATGAAIILLA